MTKKSNLVLVVSKAGDFQNGLLALMTSIPPTSTVLVAEDAGSALRMVKNHHPALIILDLSSTQALDVINQIKAQWARIHLIVLAEDIKQQKEAEACEADNVLLKGFPAQKLIEIVEKILDPKEDTPLVQANPESMTKPD